MRLLAISDEPLDAPIDHVVNHVACAAPGAQYAPVEVFVLPSHFEGQSNAMAEALMCGVPPSRSTSAATPR